MALSVFTYFLITLFLSLSSLAHSRRPRRRYEISVHVGDGDQTESSMRSLIVEMSDEFGSYRKGCDIWGPFSRNSVYSCRISTRRAFNAVKIRTKSGDRVGLRQITVRDTALFRPLFKWTNNEKIPSSRGEPKAWLWIGYGSHDASPEFYFNNPMVSYTGMPRKMRVKIDIGSCFQCGSSTSAVQVWFVDGNGRVDDRPICEIRGALYSRGMSLSCDFWETRRMGGVVLGNDDTDALGLSMVQVTDVTGRPVDHFIYGSDTDAPWAANTYYADMWLQGKVNPKHEFRFNLRN